MSHKVLCLLFYSVFCCPVRLNYNLPAGYGASAVTQGKEKGKKKEKKDEVLGLEDGILGAG